MTFDLQARLRNRIVGSSRGDSTIWFIGLFLLTPALYLLLHNGYTLLVGITALGLMIAMWQANRTFGLVAMFSFLLLLGDIRRIVGLVAGPQGLDPLLLVVPVFTLYVALPILLRLRLSDKLSKAMLAWMALMFFGIFNPRQGPIAVGIAGALFWIVPTLWYWIGQTYATERNLFILFYRVFIPLGVLAAALGLFQTYFGFLPWEDAWARSQPGQYVMFSGQIRPFGFSTSGVEYAMTIMIATVTVIAAIYSGRRAYALLLPILLSALFLSSSRGAIVKVLFATAMIWAIHGTRGRRWLPRLLFALGLGTTALIYSAATASSDTVSIQNKKASSAQLAASHVTQGLAHPLDQKYSTGGIHAAMVWVGIVRGFTYPIGTGVGAVTLGAGKFGGDATISGSTEIDISDSFVTLGFVGGILYIFIIYQACALTIKRVSGGHPATSLALIGLLSAMLGTWVPPAYSPGPLVWFCIGGLAQQKLTIGTEPHE